MKTIDIPKTVVDEVIAEVRRHKEAIAAEHDYNVDSLLRGLRERQQSNPRLVSRIKDDQGGASEPPPVAEVGEKAMTMKQEPEGEAPEDGGGR